MDAKGQCKIARIGYGIIAIAVFCGAVALFYGGCSRTDNATTGTGADSASATQQVERITDLNGLAERENQSAREAVTRADDRAAEAADLNQRVTEQLEESRQLVNEIQADNQRAKQLLDELIADAESGRTQGEKN